MSACIMCGYPNVPGHFCSSCAAIEQHKLQRRRRVVALRRTIGCEHLFGPWGIGPRRQSKGRSWWIRECTRCRTHDEELSAHRPTDENDISWIKL